VVAYHAVAVSWPSFSWRFSTEISVQLNSNFFS
jgi:hypothetical protein